MFIILQYFVLCTKIVINKNLQQISSCGCVLHCFDHCPLTWESDAAVFHAMIASTFCSLFCPHFAPADFSIKLMQECRAVKTSGNLFEAQAHRAWCNRWVRKISEVAVILPKLRGESAKRRKELIFKKETAMFRAKSSNWVVRKSRIYHVYNESITVCVDLIIYREP